MNEETRNVMIVAGVVIGFCTLVVGMTIHGIVQALMGCGAA